MSKGPARKPWKLTFEEVRQRYEAGEAALSLAKECGFKSSSPVVRALSEAGVPLRKRGHAGAAPRWRSHKKETRECKSELCSNVFEVYPTSNKKYCKTECRYASVEFADKLSDIHARHRITDVNEQDRIGTCSVCGSVSVRPRERLNKHQVRVRRWRCNRTQRLSMWARIHSISLSDVQEFLNRQEDKCAICRSPFDFTARRGFHLDHCHRTGKVRGFLCSNCNTGLGLFKDDPVRLRAALEYIGQS